jgi:hypothetical protein
VKRSPLRRGKPLARTGKLNPGKKGFRKYDGQAEFRAAVLERDGGCQRLSPACSGRVDAHHLIEKGTLAKRGVPELAADPANGIALCRWHHDAHHNRMCPLGWEHVPARAKDFADALNLTDYLTRVYLVKEDKHD